MKTHWLTVGADATDCGIEASQHDHPGLAMMRISRAGGLTDIFIPIKVSQKEDRVTCLRCRMARVHRGVSQTPSL